ncbi:SAM-dependent methyltransferase [Hoeflea sp. BAL378]|uniref:class I SAM-dependent methyltransferase n=1 Tax=Hoeflea sp. BAL378 TaxID=1547437 RepID=UPI000513B83B|nr:class I SAM-dependent methyltransferase [Hoeflea sp. BAL378]KGF70547.1 SAM-dependent methyltransferase [Hoeflea sp. BAL378]
MRCRHCGGGDVIPFLDLGLAPPSNSYLRAEDLSRPEKHYPLVIRTCTACWLTQTEDFADREEFFSGDYAYFSSFSRTWLDHASAYVAAMRDRFGLGPDSLVAEVAANDGYLLQYVQALGIPCYGVEPTHGTAEAARAKGIEIVEAFFGRDLAATLAGEGRQADLIAANNVLAHVPDINDFVAGFALLLKPAGVATFEFPHILEMVRGNQFDTAYHEHYSYLSLLAVERIFRKNGLTVFDVGTTPHHGGSLRVYACRADHSAHAVAPAVAGMLETERKAGLDGETFYAGFQASAESARDAFREFLTDMRAAGQKVAAYGAAAKGNTLLNFAGATARDIAFVVDRNPAKQGRYLPGSHIPIVGEDTLLSERPDKVVILPWNIETEIRSQLSCIKDWGGQFVTAIPSLAIRE